MNTLTVIVKPTNQCNLSCKYCYAKKENPESMDDRTLENLTRQLSVSDKDGFSIIWHGGEPLLMGLDFFRRALELQKFYGKDKYFRNSLQTNATLIDDKVLDFCEEKGVSIGTSLDGPEPINDETRVYPDGSGTFRNIYRGIELIRERNKGLHGKMIGGGAIVVLNRRNIGRIDEIFDFFRREKIHMKVNPLVKSGNTPNDLGISPQEYGNALVQLFDRWFYQTEFTISVEPLNEILGNLLTENPISCNFGTGCKDRILSIGSNGDVYPCGRFDGVNEFRIGNINEDNLMEILMKKQQNPYSRDSKQASCKKCDYQKICNGGCMYSGYMKRGEIEDKDFYCPSYKILFSHLSKALKSELEKSGIQLSV
jgi:uncharacterized protein